MAHYTIKQTKSLSPLSYSEIDAEVIRDEEGVYLLKRDEQGKTYKTLIEKDYDFYQLLTKDRVAAQVPAVNFHIYVSSACNINCPICYEPQELKEPSLEEIEGLLKNLQNKLIAIMGREPTCRKDLFQIIRIANKKNQTCLLTNGIKLADYEYTWELKKSGLKGIFFSFNGFKDKIYEQMNGRPLLDLKLKALENIKKIGIKTILSVTIARGINDDQIRELCDYCFKNRSFIRELRIRTITPVGKYLEIEPYCMSELVGIIAKSLGINKDDIIKEYIFWREFAEAWKFFIPYHARNYFRNRLCSFFFHIKKKDGFSSIGKDMDIERLKKTKFKKLLLVYYLIRNYGLCYIFEKFSFILRLPKIFKNKDILMVILRYWPNINNLDIDENKKCTSLYYKNGKFHHFCYHNIIDSKFTPKEIRC